MFTLCGGVTCYFSKFISSVLFESTVIAEYIDETTPPSLHPNNILIKSENKALYGLAGEILACINRLIKAKELEPHNAAFFDV